MNRTIYYIILLVLGSQFTFMGCVPASDPEPSPDPPTSSTYFPPLSGSEWSTVSPDRLGWDVTKLAELHTYLADKKTKGFIILKNGQIVVEEYYNNHGENQNWTWFSAAKSLTSVLAGIAADEANLDLSAPTSTYLGSEWSSLDRDQEDSITVRHHLTMSTGLNNPIGRLNEWTCTSPECLTYLAPAGTRWSYHQGAFTLTQDIITSAVGQNFKQYCQQRVQSKIGMNGNWSDLGNIRVFSSNTRSMARFGHLVLNKGVWDQDTIYSSAYHEDMVNTSQEMNKSYGYLWWLNGKGSFLGTLDQRVYPSSLIPNGPSDMYCALGAQDQKIYVIPSQNLVVVRCGQSAGNTEFANSSFDNELWGLLSAIIN